MVSSGKVQTMFPDFAQHVCLRPPAEHTLQPPHVGSGRAPTRASILHKLPSNPPPPRLQPRPPGRRLERPGSRRRRSWSSWSWWRWGGWWLLVHCGNVPLSRKCYQSVSGLGGRGGFAQVSPTIKILLLTSLSNPVPSFLCFGLAHLRRE